MIHRIDVLAREWADPHVASDHELARLLDPPAAWARVVVLGDSVAEGVREPAPGYRDLGWADRLRAGLKLARPGAVLTNLGRRHLTAAEVRAAQLDAALALAPDLAIVVAGGNDLLKRAFDPEALRADLLALLVPLREAGADVLTMDLFDSAHNPHVAPALAAPMGARLGQLVELTRAVSAAAGGIHVPLRDHPAATDTDIYARDGLHLDARGHAIVGTALARHLGAISGPPARA
jgi:lysophospholipase L1-like esterase